VRDERPWLLLVPVMIAAGCSAGRGPDVLTIEGARYSQVFDAAVEVARQEGLYAVFRDRRGGVIETETRHAPTVLEPWHADGAAAAQRWENTLANQRRRARFEFRVADAAHSGQAERSSPDPLGGDETSLDLTTAAEPLLLSVQVVLERAYQPDIRRSSWTRLASRQSTTPGEPTFFWVPVSRDPDFERRLLARIEESLRRSDGPTSVRDTGQPG
jgi:hypothetical protein